MNHTAAYVSPRPIGYFAMVRLPMDGKANPITEWCPREREHKPKRFNDAYSALRAATDRLESYFNGNMRREGETILGPRKRAEALFAEVGS